MVPGLINLAELYHVVTLMGFLQGAILTFWLWQRRSLQGGIFLVFHMSAISIVMLFPLLSESFGLRYTWPLHVVVCFLFQWMFLYVRQFHRPVKRKDWTWHVVLPAVFLMALAGWIYTGLQEADPGELENNGWVTFFSIVKIVFNLGYVLFTLRLLQRHRQLTHSVYAETSQVDLWWVSKLIAGFLLLIVMAAVLYFLARFCGWPMETMDMLTYIGFLVYLYYAYYFAVHQRTVLSLTVTQEQEVSDDRPKGKYLRSTLTQDQAKLIYNCIQEIMEQKQLFRDSELTLPALAEATGAPTYHVSQVLSEQAGANFYDFINGFRVEAAKRLLLDPSKKHYTVMAIAYESGFNSKTTFNKVFRKVTGLTPTEFLANASSRH